MYEHAAERCIKITLQAVKTQQKGQITPCVICVQDEIGKRELVPTSDKREECRNSQGWSGRGQRDMQKSLCLRSSIEPRRLF